MRLLPAWCEGQEPSKGEVYIVKDVPLFENSTPKYQMAKKAAFLFLYHAKWVSKYVLTSHEEVWRNSANTPDQAIRAGVCIGKILQLDVDLASLGQLVIIESFWRSAVVILYTLVSNDWKVFSTVIIWMWK